MNSVFMLDSPERHISAFPVSNNAALLAWHRAHGGGMTLVMSGENGAARPAPAWSGVAAIDRALLGDARNPEPHTAQVGRLLQQFPEQCRAVTFAGRRPLDAALLDRDGTIIQDFHYLTDPDSVQILPGAIDGLQRLQRLGVKLVIVTNQSGVGVGAISPEALTSVNHRLVTLLGEAGITISGIYICPHRRDAGCRCRKPGTLMAEQARDDLGIDLDRVLMVGDKALDLGLGRALKAPSFLVTTGHGKATLAEGAVVPDYVVDGLDAIADICEAAAGLPSPVALPTSLELHS
jgi:histidinol-phosphate phosphatase family protein